MPNIYTVTDEDVADLKPNQVGPNHWEFPDGFILSALGFAWVNALGWYRWTRTSEAKPKDLSWGQGHKARVPVDQLPRLSGKGKKLPPVNTDLIDNSGAFKKQADATRRNFEGES